MLPGNEQSTGYLTDASGGKLAQGNYDGSDGGLFMGLAAAGLGGFGLQAAGLGAGAAGGLNGGGSAMFGGLEGLDAAAAASGSGGFSGGALGIPGATYAMPGAEAGFGLANVGATAGAALPEVAGGAVAAGSAAGLGGAAAGGAAASSAMPWLEAAKIGSPLLGAALASGAARSAAGTQSAATRDAIAEQRRVADRSYADQSPYRAAGVGALGQLQSGINKPTTSAETGPGTKSQISSKTSRNLRPVRATSDGLVVTPSTRPMAVASLISLTSAVSMKNFIPGLRVRFCWRCVSAC